MNKMGFGSEHVISMIEDVCKMKLLPADIVVIKNYFSTFPKEKKLAKK